MKFLFVDGHYYLYRSFYAIRDLRNSRGEPTNAIYAFTKALRKMLADVRPTHGAVLWDAGIPARRMELQPAYKQQRPSMPDDLRAQEESVMRLCPLLGLPSIELPETEADDLIASLTRAALDAHPAAEVVIASADKDLLQLVQEQVRVYSTAKADLARLDSASPPQGAGSVSAGFVLLGVDAVRAKWGVPPERIADVLSLTGDSADNIPGVPGVGEKTAAALIQQFGSLEALLAAPQEIAKVGLREKILSSREIIRQNAEMVRLDRDLSCPLAWEEMAWCPQPTALVEFLRDCEFRSLLAEVEAEVAQVKSDSCCLPVAEAALPESPRNGDAQVSSLVSAQTDFWAVLESPAPHG